MNYQQPDVHLPVENSPTADLAQWLQHQERMSVREVDMGLERCRIVARRLWQGRAPQRVISVAGTNGKGSSVAMLDSILRAAGYRVGSYYSPHLERYNERICIQGEPVSDAALCEAFERVEAVREDVPLTYFEFGTLAAWDIMSRSDLDVSILEVGLGGRLDAVNTWDADLSLITSISLDHQKWLGKDREAIGYEKAGIMRSGKPAICSDPSPPSSLLRYADSIGAPLSVINRDFSWRSTENGVRSWELCIADAMACGELPPPHRYSRCQWDNAAGVVMAAHRLNHSGLPVPIEAIRAGLQQCYLPCRFQVIPGKPEYVLDVAHNVEAAEELRESLTAMSPVDTTEIIVGILHDKDINGILSTLLPVVTGKWHMVSLSGSRAVTAERLQQSLPGNEIHKPVKLYPDVASALNHIQASPVLPGRVVITGSFLTLGPALTWMRHRDLL